MNVFIRTMFNFFALIAALPLLIGAGFFIPLLSVVVPTLLGALSLPVVWIYTLFRKRKKFDLKKSLSHVNRAKSLNLKNARFMGRNFSWKNLDSAKFTGAELERVNFQGASLVNADLTAANLKGANLKNVKTKGVKWKDAIFDEHTLLPFNYQQAKKLGLRQAA